MKNLFIFDNSITEASLRKIKLSAASGDAMIIFALTSNPEIIKMAENAIFNKTGARPKILASALLIDKEVDKLRMRINKLVGAAGEMTIKGVRIKEYFFIAQRDISAWWFSQLSEKNTIKNPGLFKIAQVEAIANALNTNEISKCFIAVRDRELRQTIIAICRKRNIRLILSGNKRQGNTPLPKLLRQYLHESNRLSIIFARASVTFASRIFRAVQARAAFGPMPRNLRDQNIEMLVCSYFPCVSPLNIKNGRLENRFLGPLEQFLKSTMKKIVFLWLFVYVDNRTYGDAIRLAKQMQNKGENGFLLEQFYTVAGVLRICRQWAILIYRYFKIRYKLNAGIARLFGRNEYLAIIKKMNDRSFIGWQGLESLIYLELFCVALKHLPSARRCLHFAEMHSWEIALNAAKRKYAPEMETIGYVHASVSPNYFFYFRDQTEISKNKYDYPADDIIAVNGGITGSLLRQSPYPRVEEIEAARFLYLDEKLKCPAPIKTDNLIIVATSASRLETEEMISLVKGAFYGASAFKILFKGHPTTPINDIFKKLKILQTMNFRITETPINELLDQAKIFIVGDSCVALEALAVGCRVIIPVLSSWIFMSPLKGHEEFYTRTYDALELKNKTEELMLATDKAEQKVHKFIKSYWHLDAALPRWEQLMKL